MEILAETYVSLIILFVLGYIAIIVEPIIKINKSSPALFFAVVLWSVYFLLSKQSLPEKMSSFSHHVSDVSQIIFFLMGAMTLVELIDTHHGFKIITDCISTSSKVKMLWIIALISFFLSAILDNLTTAILMISLLKKLVPEHKERFLLGCIVVVASNAGGAWSPIGDITTTMLWINGQISTLAVMKSLFIPSIVSLLVPLIYFSIGLKGRLPKTKDEPNIPQEPGAKLVFCLGIGGLLFVPVFKTLTGLPPFMGVLIALAVLWFVTDLMHEGHQDRFHLKVPHILTRIDTSGVLFFLGILLAVDALQTAGILRDLAEWLSHSVSSLPMIATFIGIFSAIVDNVPLVAATMGMYSLEQFPVDDKFWHMIAYAAGTGGSILIIGSAPGVALMGLDKGDFISYMKKASIPVLIGFFAGMGTYLLLNI